MTNSYETHVQGLYAAALKDATDKFPMLRAEFERDLSRLHSAVEARGLSFVMIDLPDHCKHLDRCLNEGLLTLSNLPYAASWKKGCPIPKLFRGLYMRIFDLCGVLRVDCDAVAIRTLRQLLLLCKKIRMETSNERKWKTISQFFAVDEGLRLPTLQWQEDEIRWPSQRLYLGDDLDSPRAGRDHDRDLFHDHVPQPTPHSISSDFAFVAQLVADYVVQSFGSFSATEWRAKHGPGAVADHGGHGYSKYSFPNWPAKLDRVFPSDTFAYANMSLAALDSDGDVCGLRNHEPPSRLILVPKTLKAPRLIASEPTAHQWCQQILLDYFATRLRTSLISSSVRLRDQSFNQEGARRASLTGDFATVDLSEASDRVSCWAFERIFRSRPDVIEAVHASRTRWVRNSIDRNSPGFYILRKLSCMGSAITFPVQTIIFSIMAIASIHHARGIPVTRRSIRRLSKEVRVFGDDIIIPSDALVELRDVLGYLQLKVNDNKTHAKGKFRESCGLDVWNGIDVTPSYSLTYPEMSRPESIISCIESSNNFSRRGYHHIAEAMKTRTEEVCHHDIPILAPDSGLLGWKRDYWKCYSPRRTRWNKHLHCLEARVISLRTSVAKLPDHSPRSLYQYFTDNPDPTNPWISGIPSRGRVHLRPSWERLEG